MHLTQVLSNRVRFDYDDDKGGEFVEIFLISDKEEELFCRVNQEQIVDGQNFFNLALQFAQVAAQRKQNKKQIVTAQLTGITPP